MNAYTQQQQQQRMAAAAAHAQDTEHSVLPPGDSLTKSSSTLMHEGQMTNSYHPIGSTVTSHWQTVQALQQMPTRVS